MLSLAFNKWKQKICLSLPNGFRCKRRAAGGWWFYTRPENGPTYVWLQDDSPEGPPTHFITKIKEPHGDIHKRV